MYLEIEEEKYNKIIKLVGEFEVIKSAYTVLIPMEIYTGILEDLIELITIDREHIEDLERENQDLIWSVYQITTGDYDD